MTYHLILVAVLGIIFFGIIIVGLIISGILGVLTHAAPQIIMRLIARKDVQSLSETAKENEGFAPPQGTEVNEDSYD